MKKDELNYIITGLTFKTLSQLLTHLKIFFIFMQDNASIHVSQNLERNKSRTIAELLNQFGIELFGWLSISPDLNPVEHVWSLLDKMVKHKLRR